MFLSMIIKGFHQSVIAPSPPVKEQRQLEESQSLPRCFTFYKLSGNVEEHLWPNCLCDTERLFFSYQAYVPQLKHYQETQKDISFS